MGRLLQQVRQACPPSVLGLYRGQDPRPVRHHRGHSVYRNIRVCPEAWQQALSDALPSGKLFSTSNRFKQNDLHFTFQPYKYLHMLRLLEAGYSTRAQDYTRVLAEYVTESVSAGHGIEQVTVPNWVNNTLYLAEKLKYLVRYQSLRF